MIIVEERTSGAYVLSMDPPERVAIAEIAVTFSIPKEEALIAIIYRGMDSITKQCKTEVGKRSVKREAEARKATGG
jgi:hypothetical protein